MLVGVVLCGGKSSRMGQDKGLLQFYDRPQWQEVYYLLKPLCDKVVISLNPKQANNWEIDSSHSLVIDKTIYQHHGPMTGLMSVIDEYPDQPIFLVACDYPFLRSEHLLTLVNHHSHDYEVVCYENKGYPEPLVTILEASAIEKIQYFYRAGNDSILKFIRSANAKMVKCENPAMLTNVNTAEEFAQFQREK